VIEGDVLAHAEQIRLGKERVGPEPLRQLLAPARRRPAEIADVAAAEGRQAGRGLRLFFAQRGPQRLERLRPQREALVAGADVAVAAERSLEEERVVRGVLIEEAKDAEGRQQITGQFDGGCDASKAGSGSGSSCPHRNGCVRNDQAV
jgi:hypothetical protein